MASFKNFKEAHEFLKIEDDPKELVSGNAVTGISSLRMIYHPKSLNSSDLEGTFVHCVGKGKQSTPGYPTLNQDALEQLPFFKSKNLSNPFPLLYKSGHNKVYFLGHYIVSDIIKTQTWSGFTYFKIALIKQY
jgi:hypothetical protein